MDGIERCIDDEIPFEIPESWVWERWGNISESIQYGYNAPAKDNGRIKMVRISDIQNNLVSWDTVPFCPVNTSSNPSHQNLNVVNFRKYYPDPNSIARST